MTCAIAVESSCLATSWNPKYNISIDEERVLALQRLQAMCDNNYISVLDFRNNPLRIFAAHELSAVVDPAMTTKMTVQFNLFGGTVLKLGTERHHDKLLPGNFMTASALTHWGSALFPWQVNHLELDAINDKVGCIRAHCLLMC